MQPKNSSLRIAETAFTAIDLGFLRFPAHGSTFPNREGGKPMLYALDSRGAIANLPLRNLITGELIDRISSINQVEALAGLSKSGVPWAAIAADRLQLPLSVVHLSGPRTSGLQRQIEGDVAGKRAIVVDNFTKTGKSLIQSADLLEAAGANVVGFLTIAAAKPGVLGKPLYAVWTLDQLLTAAVSRNVITPAHLQQILSEENQ